MTRPLPRAEYSLWVHLGMAAVVGLTMVLVGLFISWRVRATHDLINTVDAHLLRQDADTKAMIENQAKILENQNEGLSRLRRLAK